MNTYEIALRSRVRFNESWLNCGCQRLYGIERTAPAVLAGVVTSRKADELLDYRHRPLQRVDSCSVRGSSQVRAVRFSSRRSRIASPEETIFRSPIQTQETLEHCARRLG